MRYLMYYAGGFMKKFPLDRSMVTIGRGRGSDLVIDDPSISRKHCRVEVSADQLRIVDLGSHNGTYLGRKRVQEALVPLNQSFGVGDVEFYFKRGEVREFQVCPELAAIISSVGKSKRERGSDEKTSDSATKMNAVLAAVAELALRLEDFSVFLEEARAKLTLLGFAGSLFYAGTDGTRVLFDSLFSTRRLDGRELVRLLVKEEGTLSPDQGSIMYRSYRSAVPGLGFRLIHFTDPVDGPTASSMDTFFHTLAEIIASHRRLSLADTPILPQEQILYQGETVRLIGSSPAMRNLVDVIRKIAGKKSAVLVLGENGSGKELVARMVHELSGRGNYVAINCAAIPSALLESELFGSEAGAFTDARKRKIGKIELSSGGTLVLDEIGDMPLDLQAKLLRAIQEKAISRLGGNELIEVDLRIVSLTNRDIYRLVEEGRFREDLFFRLRVHELTIPPLRERKEDIQALILHFSGVYAKQNGIVPGGFSKAAYDCLTHYSWPGNIRELENEVSRIMEIIDDNELIGTHHILPSIVRRWEQTPRLPEEPGGVDIKQKMEETERRELAALLQQNDGNKMKTSRILGMSYRGLLKKLKRLGLTTSD